MKQLIFLVLVSLHLTAIAQSPEIGDTTLLNSSASNRQRVFFGGPNKDELYGRTNTGAIKRYAPVRSVNGKIGSVTLIKSDFPFLSNVDNTADVSKPVSAATLTALNRKAESMTLTQLRSSTNLLPPEVVFLTEPGKYGFFRLDPSISSDADDGQNVVLTAASLRYRRVPITVPNGTIPVSALLVNGSPVVGSFLRYDGSWAVPTGGGGGSGAVNSASNINTAGVGIFQTLSGSDLQFKGIQAGSNRVSVVDNSNNKTITLDVNTANLTLPASQITGLGTVAVSNNYADLTGKPTLGAVATSNSYTDLINRPSLAAVATSNSYGDLSNRPTLGTSAGLDIAASGNAASTQVVKGNDTRLTDSRTPTAHQHVTGDVTGLQGSLDLLAPIASPTFTGTPKAPTQTLSDNSTNLATTAWVKAQNYGSGSGGEVNTGSNVNTLGIGVYKAKVGADLQFKGLRAGSNRVGITDNTTNNTVDIDLNTANITLPSGQITGLAPVATSGVYSDLTGKPTLSTVAGTGVYNDLTGKPTLGTASALNVAATGNAATGEVVKGDDSRLTNARTPTAHGHAISEVTNLQVTLDAKAPVASPTFTGVPVVPSPGANDNSTQATNTAWVRTWVQSQNYASGSGVGETNTGSNVNSAGVGVYNAKTGTNLEFKGIRPGSTKVSVTDNTANKTVDVDVNEANLTLAQSQVTGLATALSGKEPTIASGTTAQYIRGDKSLATLDKTAIGLSNADNTSDANKPVSTAVGTALAGKEPTITTGTSSQVILGNKALGTLNPALVSLGNVSNSLQVINAGGAVSSGAGLLSARPSAGTLGRFYYATDNSTEYYDNGTAWVVQQSAVTGDIAISAGGTTATLPTVNSNVGTFGSATTVPVITANAKGQITGVTISAITPVGIGAEPAITAGTTGQVILGNKTLGTLNPTLVGLSNVPNVDATNSANISAGTLSAARLPAFTGDATTTAGSAAVTVGRIRGVTVSTTTPANGQVLQYNSTNTQYEPVTLGSAGEANTATNTGTGGVGVFDAKAGVNLGFRNVNAGSNKISITNDAANKEIDVDVNQANLSIATSQLTGTLPAATFPAQTGDVTNTAGSLANTIGANVVTNAKAAQMAANTLKGNNTGATANQADLTVTQVKTLLAIDQVSNTSDASKPVSTAQQTALNAKENTITAGTTAQYYRGDKTFQTLDKTAVGLANVDNTSDANKPVSTLVQTEMDKRAANMTVAQLRANNAASPPPVVYITDDGKEGQFRYVSTDANTADNTGITLVTAAGKRYFRVWNRAEVNVKWFGAIGQGTQNEAPSIQLAINYARNQTLLNGGNNRITVTFPSGTYKIDAAIDATDANGIHLKGGGAGKYINTLIDGNTGGIMFDMTGSQMCLVEGFTFISDRNASQPSKIGVQFALSKDIATGIQKGGLNCAIRNCYFQMNDMASANGGLGTIGILNCRSEEFFIDNCVINANCPLVFTSSYTMSTLTPYNFVISSPYAAVQTDNNGSMGVINIVGTSLIAVSRRSPSMVLSGVNAFNFEGYIGRFGDPAIGFTTGAEETAIRFYNTTYSVKIRATVESYTTLFDLAPSGNLFNSEINCTVANQRGTQYDVNNNWVAAPTAPVMTMQRGSTINGSVIKIAFGNGQNEIGNVRLLLASESENGGLDQSLCAIADTHIHCQQWFDNLRMMQSDLRKRSTDVHLHHGQSVSKEGEFWVKKYAFPKTIGAFTNNTGGVAGNIVRFSRINNGSTTTNGAFYTLRYQGMITIGNDGSGTNAMGTVEGEVVLNQGIDGNPVAADGFGTQNIKVTGNGAYLNITEVVPSITTINSSTYGLTLTVKGTGTGNGETVRFHGIVRISSWSRAQESILFD